MDKEILLEIASKYKIDVERIGAKIDTSRGDDDIRYAYPINENQYILKITNTSMMNEEYMAPINELVDRYREIGVYAPKMLTLENGCVVYEFIYNGMKWRAYIEEYAKYSSYKETDSIDYNLKEEMLEYVGKLASKYSFAPLCEHYSMWTIIRLHALDTEIDEKQDNLNQLCEALKKYGLAELSERINDKNIKCRSKIKKSIDQLPTCTYQGDLNSTNILVDQYNHFKGIIDFNMSGEEVNINCFINESMYYLEMEDFDTLSAQEIFEKMNRVFDLLIHKICEYYEMNELELLLFPSYKLITYLSFYPNVILMINQLENNQVKVVNLIERFLKIEGLVE